MYVKTEKGWFKHLDFMILDLLCIELVFVLSYFIRHGQYFLFHVSIYKEMILILMAFHIIIVFFMESYKGILRRGHLQELKAVLKYNIILFAGMMTYMLFRKNTGEYSRILLILFFVMDCIAMWFLHEGYKRFLQYRNIGKSKTQRLILLTTAQNVDRHVKRLLDNELGATRLYGVVLTDTNNAVGTKIHDIPVVANVTNAYEYAKLHIVDEILCADQAVKTEYLNGFLDMGITIHISIEAFLDIRRGEVNQVSGVPVITLSINTVTDRQLFIKRVIDIVSAFFGIIVTFIAMIVFGPIIYIQSPGPIFFVQERVGKNGRRFCIYKLRTMYMDAEEHKKELMEHNEMKGFMFKMADDPRIIPIGKFLRRTSIDELPQFFNILKGDMSLVGTRPPTVDEYEMYEMKHKSRLATKPGLTGMWQVSGRSNIDEFEKIVELDNEYIQNWSLGMDVKLIWKTVGVVLKGRGAE